MIKKLSIFGAALAMTAGATVATTPAQAQYYGDRYYARDGYYQSGRDYRGDRGYRNRGYYNDNRGYYGNGRTYYGRNSYAYRCRSNGSTGTIVGAIAGGLLGDAIVGRRGNDTVGAIVGAGVGALAGRAIERSGSNRC